MILTETLTWVDKILANKLGFREIRKMDEIFACKNNFKMSKLIKIIQSI